MKIKTKLLTGVALDQAVTQALGTANARWRTNDKGPRFVYVDAHGYCCILRNAVALFDFEAARPPAWTFSPSTIWGQCMPIALQANIVYVPSGLSVGGRPTSAIAGQWEFNKASGQWQVFETCEGPDPMVAMMRTLVLWKIGPVVSIPRVLK